MTGSSNVPQTHAPVLCGRPDGSDFGLPVTRAILPALLGRFKLLIITFITSVPVEWGKALPTPKWSISFERVFTCVKTLLAHSVSMDVSGSLYGFGERSEERQVAFAALARAVAAITRLDADSARDPLRSAWVRVEREMALAAAARETGHEADARSIIAARLGALTLPRGHVQLGDLDERTRRWALIAQRKGLGELRALVARLAPDRGTRDLVGLAERVARALGECTQSSWEFDKDPLTGAPTLRSVPAEAGAVDAGDLALALPFALRRIGATSTLLPGLVGRPRAFAREEVTPLAALTSWAEALERQAGEGASRLRELHLYAGQVERQLSDVRRPAALRRLVAVALKSWSVWAAKLARDTRVDISSAWRTLEQAAELGLVVEVPGQKRSRGDGTLYAAPPWLRMAGLMSVRRGRPAAKAFNGADGAGLGDAIAELDAAMAAADRLTGQRRIAPESAVE